MHARDEVCDRPGLLDPEHALALALSFVRPVHDTEAIALADGVGRVCVEAIASAMPLPPFDQSAVDGYALHEQDLSATTPRGLRRIGKVTAGSAAAMVLNPGETVKLLTGAPIPLGACAVVMEEKTRIDDGQVHLDFAVARGMNIRRRGEDVMTGAVLVEAARLLDARHIAMLSAAGIDRVTVRRRIRVAVISTGDELAARGEPLRGTQLHDANGPMLMGLLASPATRTEYLGRLRDDRLRLARAFALAATSCDLIVCSGGVSGSDADHVVPAIEDAGGTCRAVSLALKPGKPLGVGRLGAASVLALPGNPAAAMVGALLFARPMLEALAGIAPSRFAATAARTADVFFHRPGRAEFVPAGITGVDAHGVPLIEKLGRGGSARLRPLILADGLARIPADAGDLQAGEWIDFFPFKSRFGL